MVEGICFINSAISQQADRDLEATIVLSTFGFQDGATLILGKVCG